MLKLFVFTLLFSLSFIALQAQKKPDKNSLEHLLAYQTFEKTHFLYKLEKRIRQGDKIALYEIAPYLNSNKKMIEYLGYHLLEPKECEVARRIIEENSLFLSSELVIDEKLTNQQFLAFLIKNEAKITFDDLTDCFLITPLSERKSVFQLKKWNKDTINIEKKQVIEIMVRDITLYNHINQKNPWCLVQIASHYFKTRDRFNNYAFDEIKYIELIQQLTGLEIAVNNDKKELSFISYTEYGTTTKLNYLTYWVQYYKEYKWDEDKQIFTTNHSPIAEVNEIETLFKQLSSENDSLAFQSWEKLAVSDASEVGRVAMLYKKANIKHNYCLGYHIYDCIKMLVQLTQYCKNNEVAFQPDKELLKKLLSLKETNISFKERYELENNLIKFLTLSNITALEYWAFLYSKDDTKTFQPSIGRIIDVFYQLHWKEIQTDEKQLKLYLKKAYLFENLRSDAAVCGRYLRRFRQNADYTNTLLLQIEQTTTDEDIVSQIKLLKNYPPKPLRSAIPAKYSEWNPKDIHMKDIKKEFYKILKPYNARANYEREIPIGNFLAKLSYGQIAEALTLIDTIRFDYESNKYCFLEHNFGLPINSYSDNLKEELAAFKTLYAQKTEFEVYKHYVTQLGYQIFTADNQLDYAAIYKILTFDIAREFTVWSYREDGIYAIIRLLEITHQTRLGFIHKASNNSCGFIGGIEERAFAWRNYLKTEKLVNFLPEEEPFSMND